MHPVLNIAHLEKYEQSPPEFGVRPTTRMRPEEFQDLVQEVEIERIVQQRMFKAPWQESANHQIQGPIQGIFPQMRMNGRLGSS